MPARLLLILLCTPILLASVAVASEPTCVDGHGLTESELLTLALTEHRRTDTEAPNLLGNSRYPLGEIRFYRQNVFPDRDHALARFANRYHLRTREAALRAALPIEGNEIDEKLRAETERTLRQKPYLADALVLVRRICGGRVDLDIIVRDVWTFEPTVEVSRSGGDNKTLAAISDINLLGTGKSLLLEYRDDSDRTGVLLELTDPNLFGSRWRGAVAVADNDDGERFAVELARPFYALDTRRAFGFSASHDQRAEDLTFLGRDQYELELETRTASAFVATSNGREGDWVNRWYYGARYFDQTVEFPETYPTTERIERRYVYPYVALQRLEDRWVERTDVDRVGVTEDIQVGWSTYLELGWSPDATGTGNVLLARASAGKRHYLTPTQLLSFDANLRGNYRLDLDTAEDVDVGVRVSYLWRQAPKWGLFALLNLRAAHNQSADRQLTLGGDQGLRGYRNRYQTGDRAYALTIEQRYYSNAYPFGLFRIGWAAFVDVGRAWFEEAPPPWIPPRDGDHFDTLADVGVGLRLESVRTRRDRIWHVDVSRPLIDGPGVNGWEITLGTKSAL